MRSTLKAQTGFPFGRPSTSEAENEFQFARRSTHDGKTEFQFAMPSTLNGQTERPFRPSSIASGVVTVAATARRRPWWWRLAAVSLRLAAGRRNHNLPRAAAATVPHRRPRSWTARDASPPLAEAISIAGGFAEKCSTRALLSPAPVEATATWEALILIRDSSLLFPSEFRRDF